MGRREEIAEALRLLINRERGKDFQHLGFQVARAKWPQLLENAYRNDRGEDAVSLSGVDSSDRHRSVACSLTATLAKVKADCKSIHKAGTQIDVLVFVTAKGVTNATKQEWAREIKREFGHGLEVIDGNALVGELERPGNQWLCRDYLGLTFEDGEPGDAYGAARTAVQVVVEGWRKETQLDAWPVIPLGLTLAVADQPKERALSLEEAVEEIRLRRWAVLSGPPGAGKSVGLVRLAQAFLSLADGPLPLLARLPDVTNRGSSLLEYVAAMPPFQAAGLSSRAIAALASEGHLFFLLDGWSEVETPKRSAAEAVIADVLRSAPAARVMVSSREADPPPRRLFATHLGVCRVSRELRASFLIDAGVMPSVVNALEADPVLRDLLRLPLFLRVVGELGLSRAEFPRGRYELLRAFTGLLEQSHAQQLRESACGGHHDLYLERLAVDMSTKGTSTLSRADALHVVAGCGKRLVEGGVIPTIPPALDVLEALVRHHVLVGGTTFRFQHEQFHELFAAEHLWREAGSPDADTGAEILRRWPPESLDQLAWEDAVRLLVEKLRAAGDPQSDRVAAAVVQQALLFDPVFAARLVRNAGKSIWSLCGGAVADVLRSLLSQSGAARQLGFLAILATGHPEFSDVVLPVASGDKDDLFHLMYAGDEPSFLCLGDDWRQALQSLPTDRRAALFFPLAKAGDPEGITFLIDVARDDPDPGLRMAARVDLAFFGFHEEAASGVEFKASSEWDPEHSPTLIEVLDDAFVTRHSTDLLRLAPSLDDRSRRRILHRLVEVGVEGVEELLEHELGASQSNEVRLPLLSALRRRDPTRAMAWLLAAMGKGECWHRWFADTLATATEEQLVALADQTLDQGLPEATLHQRLDVLCAAAPEIAAKGIAREFLRHPAPDRNSSPTRSGALAYAFGALDFESRAKGILEHCPFCEPERLFREVPRLLGPHWAYEPRGGYSDDSLRARVRGLTLSLAPVAESCSPDEAFLCAHLAALLGEVGEPDDAHLLERWIRKAQVDEARESARGNRSIVDCSHWYAGSLARLGGGASFAALLRLIQEPDYLGAASLGLAKMVAWMPDEERPGAIEKAREEIHRALTLAVDRRERGDVGKPYPQSLGEAASALADLGVLEAVPVVLRVTALDLCEWSGVGALEKLVAAGAILPARSAAQVLDSIIARAATGRHSSGQDPWTLGARAICLLLASDEPEVGVQRARAQWPGISRSSTTRMVLQGLARTGGSAAEGFLIELVKAVAGSESWVLDLAAALGATKAEGRVAFLAELWESRIARARGRAGDVGEVAKAAATAALSDTAEFAKLCALAEAVRNGQVREFVAEALAGVGTEDAALAACRLIDDALPSPLPFSASKLIMDQFSEVAPSARQGGREVWPRANNALRAHLLRLVLFDQRRKRTARGLLLKLEVQRAEFGRPIDEPRHPDASAQREGEAPWYL